MIEAPEARLLAEQFNQNIEGKTISEVIIGFTPHKFAWYHGDTDQYQQKMRGKKIGRSRSIGGMIETEIGDGLLVLAEGLNITYIPAGEKLPPKHQLLLGFDDESCIVMSVRMYGGMMFFPDGVIEGGLMEYINAASNKPQVLSDDFTQQYFLSLLQGEEMAKKSAKAALATGQTIPGLGNGVLQDILYNARINPKTKIAALSPQQHVALYDSICSTLHQMLESGGRSSETDIFGKAGRYAPYLSKDTVGQPCTRCGAVIVKEAYMGGSIYYCPGCQPKL